MSAQKETYLKFLSVLPAVVWLGTFFVTPLVIVFIYSFFERGIYGGIKYKFTLNNYLRVIDPLYLMPMLRSGYLALLTTLICLISAYPVALYIASQSRWRKQLLLLLVILPFWTNFLVRTYSWIIILRTEGALNNFLLHLGVIDTPMELLFTNKAVLLGLTYSYLPFMILPIYTSIGKIDQSLLEASADLGATPLKTIIKVILPLTKSGIVAGVILVFVPSLGTFVISDLLGGAKDLMVGNLVKDQFLAARDWPFGSALSVILMVVNLALLTMYTRTSRIQECSLADET